MRLKKLAAGAALTLACLAAGVPAAFAATADGPAIVPSRAGDLTVYCQRDVDGKSVPVEGQELELYLVASYNADGNLETEEYFADVLTDPETELQDVSTAEILSPLLSDAEKRPDPAASGTTDANGMARWTINDGESGLPLGCYLVYGTDDLSKAVIVTDGGTDKYYFPQTILVPVPYLAGEGEEAFYDYVPAAYPKPVLTTRGGGGGGGGGGGHKSGGDPDHGPGVETTASGDGGSSVTDQPDAGPGGPGGPGNVSRTSVLPKTGLLWWPVPLLAVLGVFCLVLGLALSRREKEQRRKA